MLTCLSLLTLMPASLLLGKGRGLGRDGSRGAEWGWKALGPWVEPGVGG